MRRFTVLGLLSLFCFSAPAQAGFEWMPPSEQPAQIPDITQQYETMSHDNGMNPMTMDHMGGVPAMPVMAEPLSPLAPTAIMPQRQAPQNNGQLYINPYPLQDAFRTSEPSELTSSSVEKAMVEESRMLHPLHLGAGMKTGAQPVKVPGASVNEMVPYETASLPMKSMTPMVGGEPASLPGTGMPRGPMQATPIGGFTEAVGFGRDLPLALALSQVVPTGFTHSYAEGVDPGVTVSWEGGKPWNQVLNDMLMQQGLTASIRGNQVIIQSGFQS
jgi:hypothetical protein